MRTKGADANYSEWSQTGAFSVYTAPTLSITSPGATIISMPISITATYSDMAGFTCQAATASLTQNGRTLFSEPATINGTSITSSLDVSEFLPTNGESYTVVLTARSSSSLQTTANATFTVDFVEPQAGDLNISNDPDTGYASLLATFDNSASEITYTGSTNEQYESTEGYVRSLTVDGKSEKWNQLVDITSVSTTTTNNVTFTVANGTVTVNSSGAASAQTIFNITPKATGKANHKLFITGCPSGGSATTYRLKDGYGIQSDTGNGCIDEHANDNCVAQIIIASGYTATNLVFKPMICDLTAIFGSGNEPATVDAFKATDIYKAKLAAGELYDYDAGSLVSIGSVTVYDSSIVPAPYRAVEYIESASGAYIDTGYVPDNDSGFMLDVEVQTWSNDKYYFGCFSTSPNNNGRFGVIMQYSGDGLYNYTQYCGFGGYQSIPSQRYTSTTWPDRITVECNYLDSRKAYINGGNVWNVSTFDNAGTLPIFVGAVNVNGTATAYNQRIYRLKLTQGDAVVRDYIPAEAKDGTIGLFEVMTGTFYSNAGSGSFTAGSYIDMAPTVITATLRSAGSIRDQLQAGKTSWTVERNVGVLTLVGTENWQRSVISGSSTPVYWISNSYLPASMFENRERYAAGWTTKTGDWSGYSDGDIGVPYGTGNAGILFVDSTCADVTAWKAKVAANNITVFYAKATPTTDTATSYSTIQLGTAFTVGTELDSTFELTSWDGSADAVSISVSRVNPDGTLTPLITVGASGSGLVDRYAPLNTPYQYAVTTKASSQAVKTVYVDNIIETDYWFAYWGENIAKAKWNPDNGGIQVTRPQKTRVYYAGRRDPVSYDGHAVSLTETPSWMFLGKDEVDTFVGLIEDGGRGVYKSCDGWVYHADFDLTMTPSYTAIGYYGGASLGIIRIAGERL